MPGGAQWLTPLTSQSGAVALSRAILKKLGVCMMVIKASFSRLFLLDFQEYTTEIWCESCQWISLRNIDQAASGIEAAEMRETWHISGTFLSLLNSKKLRLSCHNAMLIYWLTIQQASRISYWLSWNFFLDISYGGLKVGDLSLNQMDKTMA